MTTLVIDLSPQVYRKLQEQAERLGKTPKVMVEELLDEQLAPSLAVAGSRAQVRAALRAHGLLSEVNPVLRVQLGSPIQLADVEASLRRADGMPLSEILLEQRGAKS